MTTLAAPPSAQEVLALPAAVVETAPPEWEDVNGHVNVARYYDLHLRGAEAALRALGVDDAYRAETGWSVFSVEQHLRFLGEVHVGHEVSVHLRWVARGDKVMHAISFVVDRTTGRVANSLEVLEAHVDLTTRRACAWAPTIAERIDELVEAHTALPWPAPTCGAIGIRR